MKLEKKVIVEDLEHAASIAESLAGFPRVIDECTRVDLLGNGFKSPAIESLNCMGWIWRQWLLGTPHETIRARVEPFVEAGLKMRSMSRSWHHRSRHDLFLLNCAIFAGCESQLLKVLESISDSAGENGDTPGDGGELYAASWCGLLKHWWLGDYQKAVAESETAWSAFRDPQIMAGQKTLTTPWIKRDWKTFVERQSKDFDRMWNQARKDGWTVRSENEMEVVVRTDGCRIGYRWCWAHCAMALLAHRQGVEVATDSYWFPQHALKCGRS